MADQNANKYWICIIRIAWFLEIKNGGIKIADQKLILNINLGKI